MENFLPIFLQATGIQVLESAYIIHNSSNIETVIGRQKFLLEKYNDLIQNQYDPAYLTYTQMAIASYQELYPNRPLQEIQLTILKNPAAFNLIDFYTDSLTNSLKRFCAKQTEEINGLKTVSSKEKRSAKVLQIIQLVKQEITDKYNASSKYSQAMTEIEELGFAVKPHS